MASHRAQPPDSLAMQIAEEACEYDEDERRAFLDRRCAGHPELLERVQRLLRQAKDVQWLGDVQAESRPTIAPPPAEDFELLDEELGRGGMSVVRKARQVSLNRIVAFKELLPNHPAIRAEERFEREARVAASLKHPNIVEIFAYGRRAGSRSPFLVMEYVAGGSLKDRIQKGSLPTPEDAAALVEKVARAMHYAHQGGVIHRDLKPGNILLEEGATVSVGDCTPKVADFGLVKQLRTEDLLSVNVVLGTPDYMAPEQVGKANGLPGPVGPWTDVYALGAILFELLTGTPPFGGSSPLSDPEKLRRLREDDPTFPGPVRQQVPSALRNICLKCLRKEPLLRYGAAENLAEDLRRYRAGEKVEARGEWWWEWLGRWRKRKPAQAWAAVLGLAASALLVAAATASGFLWQAQSYSADRTFREGVARDRQGDGGRGMLLLAEALDKSPSLFAGDQHHAIRTALASVRSRLHTLEDVFTPELGSPVAPDAFQIRVMASSSDGGRVLLGSNMGKAILLDTASGRPLWDKPYDCGNAADRQDSIAAGAISPDGTQFVLATDRGDIHFGRVADGRRVGSTNTQCPDRPKAAVFTPDGRDVLVAGHQQNEHAAKLRCYRFDSGQDVALPFADTGDFYAVAYSPAGSALAYGGMNKQVWVRSLPTGERIGKPLSHAGPVFAIAFSPDGEKIATGSLDGKVRIWETRTGHRVGPDLEDRRQVRCIAFSRSGRYLVVGTEGGAARIWDLDTWLPVGQRLEQPGDVRQCLFVHEEPGPNNRPAHAITAGFDGVVRRWRLVLPTTLPHTASVTDFALRRRDDTFVVCTGCRESDGAPGWVRLWDATGKPLTERLMHQGEVLAVAISHDGTLAVSGGNDGVVSLWDLTHSSIRHRWPYGKVVKAVAFSPDGRVVACGGLGGRVQLWDVETGGKLADWHARADAWVWTVAFSSDGQTLLTDGGLAARVWRLPDEKSLQAARRGTQSISSVELVAEMAHKKEVQGVSFGPTGANVLTCGHDNKARVWSARDGSALTPELGHAGMVLVGALSPDGKIMATGSADNTARLWSVPSGHARTTPLPHDGQVRAIAFSPDGSTVVTGCDDGTAQLWRADDGLWLGAVLQHGAAVNRVAFTPGGRAVITASADGSARFWPVVSPLLGSVEQIGLGVQVLTGLRLESKAALSADEWQRSRQKLRQMGWPSWIDTTE